MKRILAVVLVMAAILWARRISVADTELPTTALALGFALVVAMVSGELLRRFKLPRLTGYLLFGLLIGPYLANLITEPMARQLQAVNGIATTLIAFIAGLTLNFERLSRQAAGTTKMIATTIAVSMAGLFVVAWALWSWLPVAPDASGVAKLAMVTLFVVIVVSFSPTMTAAVISETGARGRLSDLVLAIVVVADLLAVVLFSMAMQLARIALGESTGSDVNILVRLVWEIGGALSFGSLIGALFALYLRYVARELTLVLLAVCVLLTQVGTTQGFEPLLAAMAAGLVIQNVAVPQGDALKIAIQRGALPVLVVFFVGIGTSLQLDALLKIGAVALVLVAMRVALIRVGVMVGMRASGLDRRTGAYVWTGLISQAGITLGLASVLATEFPSWGGRVQMLLIALIAIDELLGPALFRIGLARAGEIDVLARRPLIVVSNREPYIRNYDDGHVTVVPATGGVAVALDALMREREGVWIAHGDGSADRAPLGLEEKVLVPPESPSYQLRRLQFDPREYAAYYGGFANEGLWPLCHMVDVRPKFRSEDWIAYQAVNAHFATAIDEELSTAETPTPVFIQDYHLALVASRLRDRRPTARTALFWHIPWPYPDRLRICPWRRELLAGLLANDLVAFQLENDRRNFVLAVADELDGAEIEADGQRIRCGDRVCTITAAPIGVDYDRIQHVGNDAALGLEQDRLRREFGLHADILGLGVDRLDYTKGIPERLAALDRMFTRRPELRGRLTFVQIGVPSRSSLGSYSALETEIDHQVSDVNTRHGLPGQPPPIYYHKLPLTLPSLVALYRLAQFCIVSSLHDGMNLVAKEFVAAREDEDGVLVLSALAGAAQELRDALIINPYGADDFADAIARALDMPKDERRARMQAMRRVVAGRDVFSWASDILEGLESLWTKPLQYAARAPEDAPV
jgi:trehalose-6-phosphate synthase/Kef-type K+ transport system membrane component KefB